MTPPDALPLERDVAALIVNTLRLKIDPAVIDPEQPLFREGLGLDSSMRSNCRSPFPKPMGMNCARTIRISKPSSRLSATYAAPSIKIERSSVMPCYEHRSLDRSLST